ncbi:S1 family peptidase [Streptomyces sp. MNP-20]|uniref:S1 family peptidase n=1 Tax=Streptomyces sp. MNP-20 TaxID=2721165 RepID=UPI001557825F|nr:S1 family peptidase [Streptomyces sp. MNP-20]
MFRTIRPFQRAVIAGLGAAALLGTAAAVPHATASPRAGADAPQRLAAPAAAALAGALRDELGPRSAGSYYDAAHRALVVNVLGRAAARQAEERGARARVVRHSLRELGAAQRVLERRATIAGTAWSADPRSNRVEVVADRTVTGAALARLRAVVDGLGDRASLRRVPGELAPSLSGGDGIRRSGGGCSLGFNVVKDGKPYFLTAGHCGRAGSTWSPASGPAVGTMEDSRFPGDDFALVRYTANTAHPSEVNLYDGTAQPITKAGEAIVGQKIQRSGRTTRLRGGEVTALDATVNYQQGTVKGLIKAAVCADRGDSGGSMFAGDTALGLTSGGTIGCGGGRKGPMYFQPVTEALTAYGAGIH